MPQAPESPPVPPRRPRGAPKGNSNALKHGRFTAAAIMDRAEAMALLRAIRLTIILLKEMRPPNRVPDLAAARQRLDACLAARREFLKTNRPSPPRRKAPRADARNFSQNNSPAARPERQRHPRRDEQR